MTPTQTDWQLAADALHQVFLVNFIADLESQELDYSSDSEDDNSDNSGDSDDSMDGSASSTDSSAISLSNDDDSDFRTPAETYLHHMGILYSEHYMAELTEIPKTQVFMWLLFGMYKDRFPHIFWSYLHIDPHCFDSLVEAIHDEEIFHNNSNNPQMPVDEQVVIALYCFGHYGNGSSTLMSRNNGLWLGSTWVFWYSWHRAWYHSVVFEGFWLASVCRPCSLDQTTCCCSLLSQSGDKYLGKDEAQWGPIGSCDESESRSYSKGTQLRGDLSGWTIGCSITRNRT